ncbi:acyltransferase domain-containing protein, partial [Streptomyces sp. EN23]|uniref:acyltransferase domain-containing protein n=1 Tax=Streptomyces sp. EN23 TaxID=212774 RepID=UPI00351F9513
MKSNIGHAQAAAGVAGVIKMVEALRRGVLPRTLHVDVPSGEVDWSAGAVELLVEGRVWPDVGRVRRAGVSSFGISGTNAHVILEQAPAEVLGEVGPVSGEASVGVVPLVLSGGSVGVVGELAGRVVAVGDAVVGDVSVGEVGRGLALTRAGLGHRAVVVGEGWEELRSGLVALSEGEPASGSGVISGVVPSSGGGLGFVFAGQGSQWLGMGRGLYEAFPVFAEAFDEVMGLVGEGVREVMWGLDSAPESGSGWWSGLSVDDTGVAQVGLFAFEVALFRLWVSWGVRVDCVGGHSVGEVVAAFVAGVLSLEDACRLVVARGRLMQGLALGGVMVAVEASEEEVLPLLGGGVSLAAVNGPSSVVLSGVEGVVDEVVGVFVGRGRRSKRLVVSHAFHSVLMEPMLEEFRGVVEG